MVRPRLGARRSDAHHASVTTQVVAGIPACAGTAISRYGGDPALNVNSARHTGSSMRSWSGSTGGVAATWAARQSVRSSTIGPDQSRKVSPGVCVPMPWTKTMPVRLAIPDGSASAGGSYFLDGGSAVAASVKTVGWSSPRRCMAATLASACPDSDYDADMYLDAMEFLEEERDAWAPYEALADLTDEQLSLPIDGAHGWSGRDLMAHMLAWQGVSLDAAKELAI